MLNALQIEVHEAYAIQEGRDLMETKYLLVDSYNRDRVKSALQQLKNIEDPEAEDRGTKPRDPSREEILSSYRLISDDANSFSGEFLEKMSRKPSRFAPSNGIPWTAR